MEVMRSVVAVVRCAVRAARESVALDRYGRHQRRWCRDRREKGPCFAWCL